MRSCPLVCGMVFFEANLNYKKAGYKSMKLDGFELPLQKLIPFLEEHCEGVSPSLRRTWARTQFHTHSKDLGTSSCGFKKMLEAGLRALVLEVGEDSSLELWLRTMLFEAWTSYLQVPVADDEMGDRVMRLIADATELHKLLLEHDMDAEAGVFRPVARDIWCVVTLLGVWKPGGVNAADVEEASDMLKQTRFQGIQKALAEHPLGKQVLSKTSLVLQTSGQAVAAAAKLKRSLELVKDSQLPGVHDNDGSPVFIRRELVSDMTLVGILDESLDLLEAAIEMYSRKELNGCSACAHEWASNLLAHLQNAEECLILELMVLLQETGVDKLILECTDDLAAWKSDDATRCFADLQNRFRMGGAPIDDTPLVEFLQRLITFFDGVPVELISKEVADSTIKESIAPYVSSAEARAALVGVLRLMGDVFGEPDVSPTSFFDELMRCHSEVDLHNSRLSKAVKLQGVVPDVGGTPIIKSSLKDVHYQISADDPDDPFGDIAAWNVNAPMVFDALPLLAVLPHLEEVVAQSLQKLLGEIVKSASLANLKVPVVMPTGAAPAAKCMDACMKCTTVNGKPVEGWLKNSGDERSWPSTLPTKVACQILQVMVDRGLHVGVAPMCTGLENDAGCDVTDLNALVQAIQVLEVIGKIGMCFAWIKSNYFSMHSPSLGAKGSVNVNLDKVLTATAGHLQGVSALLSGGASAAIAELEVLPWLFPIHQSEYWVGCATDTLKHMCKQVVGTVVEQLFNDSVTLLKSVPNYDHLLSDKKKVNLKMAADHLCSWPGKAALGSGCIALEKALTDLSMSYTKWGMEGTLRDAPSYEGKVVTIEENFLTGRKALATIAGVNCLANLQGKARLERRDTIIKQDFLLPDALAKLLRQQK